MHKGYYAHIPANVRYDQDLSANAKLLYGEITALTNHLGYCWATNGYFADLYQLSNRHISRMIGQLEAKGYILTEIKMQGKQVIERRIFIAVPMDKNVYTYGHECQEGIDENVQTPIDKNVHTPIDKNVQENITVINTTDINNTNNIKNNIKSQKKSESENEFDSLWKAYPRKLGSKKKARESYEKAIKKGETTYEQVQYGIEMYKKYIDYHKIAEEFIKHGSTWFNQECWSNDYTCKPKVIQGKRHGFLGLLLNEMDYEKSQGNVIDHEESINYGQETSGAVIGYATNSLPFGL
jgi:hypothetical protein